MAEVPESLNKTYSLVVDEAKLGTCVRPVPEQSTILAVVEHLQGSGHQNPVRLSTPVSDIPSRLLPSCAVPVNQLRASSTNSTRDAERCFIPARASTWRSTFLDPVINCDVEQIRDCAAHAIALPQLA